MKEKYSEKYILSLFRRNLKRQRALHDVSQMDLALDAGLTHNFINEIENGKKGISIKTIAKLCSALDIEPQQFFLSNEIDYEAARNYVSDVKSMIAKAVESATDNFLETYDK